ncbi:hypothetical protein SEA_MAGRITTE_58 [Microbacterium phage Magritte]|nr:hypothetical protein SEA_MAGRITTE_58 [Microbacterium phage Magritte]
MGGRVYLNDVERRVIREALLKWENWTEDDRSDEEWHALETLNLKGLMVDDD